MIRILFNQFSSVNTLSIISVSLKIKHKRKIPLWTKSKQAQDSTTVIGRKLYFTNYVTKTICKMHAYETLTISDISTLATVCWVTYRKLNEFDSLMVELPELYRFWEGSASIIILFTSVAVLGSETWWPSKLPPSDAWKSSHCFRTCPLYLEWVDFIQSQSLLI